MTRLLALAIHGFELACYALLIGGVVWPFLLGMEPQEFWRW